MGREEIRKEEASSVVHSSSIALLQERFRQLQKVKEMREEREIVKLLSLSQYPKTHSCSFFFNNTNTCVLFEPSISHPPNHELMMMMKTKKVPPTMLTLLPQTSLSLSPTSSHHHQPNNIPTLMDLWPATTHTTATTTSSSSDSAISFITKLNDHDDDRDDHDHDYYFDSVTDVDTSLHL